MLMSIPSALEQRLDALLGDDLATSIKHRLVVNLGAGSHHHATTGKAHTISIAPLSHDSKSTEHTPNGIERVRSKTRPNSNTPAEKEGCKEAALKSANEHNRFCSSNASPKARERRISAYV